MAKDASIALLIRKLADGWTDAHHGAANELVQAWKKALQAPIEVEGSGDGWLTFRTNLSGIRLRGMDEVPCLLLASGDKAKEAIERFRPAAAPGRLPFVLTLSEAAHEQAELGARNLRCLVLSPGQLRGVLAAEAPRQALNARLREQLPLRWLIPYNYLLPAQGNMFFGRQTELNKLLQEEDVSFAIAGPSRLGKTSLLKQYRLRLAASRDPRYTRTFEIDFYPCKDTTSDGVARFLAMKIDPSSRSHRMTAEGIVDFLRYQRSALGAPLELMFDEVDEVCQGTTFELVGDAARRGYCRLILCGRGRLLQMMLSPSSPLACRLALLRPGPLEVDAARDLLVEPLDNLGISILDSDRVVEEIFRWTGRLPHLLQFYGKKLAELAEEEGSISQNEVAALHWDFDTAQYFTSPLSDLPDSQTRLLALALLKESEHQVTIPQVRRLQAEIGLQLSHERTVEILNSLVVCNILSWDKGSYTIVNKALPLYAEKLGYLAA